MQLRLASPLMRLRAQALAFLGGTALAAFGAGCDQTGTTTTAGNNAADPILAYAGFALTADDQSDDGFTDGADTAPLDAAAHTHDDPTRPPRGDEADPAQAEGQGPGRTVLVVWGHLGDGRPPASAGDAAAVPPAEGSDAPDVAPTAWRGQIRVDNGDVHVLRVVHFDGPNDKLVRDDDPSAVSFDTMTTTRNDGLLLRITRRPNAAPAEGGAPAAGAPGDSAPEPGAEAPAGDLVFETEHFTQRIPLADVFAGNQLTFDADTAGNELMVAASLPHRCEHGLLNMRWERTDERGGTFGGKVFDDEGNERGTLTGLWGSGAHKNRFKGSFKDENGTFRGTVVGSFMVSPNRPGGAFRGHWRTEDGLEHGVLGGVFTLPERPAGDHPGPRPSGIPDDPNAPAPADDATDPSDAPDPADAPAFLGGQAHGFWRANCGGGQKACQADAKLPPPAEPACECAPAPSDESVDTCACIAPPPSTCVPPEAPPTDGQKPDAPPAE